MYKHLRSVVTLCIFSGMIWFYLGNGRALLDLTQVQERFNHLQFLSSVQPVRVGLTLFGTIFILTSLSVPGSIVVTLLTGALFGPWRGVIIVCLASSMGAGVAFLVSRFLLKDLVIRHFRVMYGKLSDRFEREGMKYLFTLRIIPVAPFIIVNLIMGTTSMRILPFIWITCLAMIPGTFMYLYAGQKFTEITSVSGILSLPLVVGLTLVGIIPYFWKWLLNFFIKEAEYGASK